MVRRVPAKWDRSETPETVESRVTGRQSGASPRQQGHSVGRGRERDIPMPYAGLGVLPIFQRTCAPACPTPTLSTAMSRLPAAPTPCTAGPSFRRRPSRPAVYPGLASPRQRARGAPDSPRVTAGLPVRHPSEPAGAMPPRRRHRVRHGARAPSPPPCPRKRNLPPWPSTPPPCPGNCPPDSSQPPLWLSPPPSAVTPAGRAGWPGHFGARNNRTPGPRTFSPARARSSKASGYWGTHGAAPSRPPCDSVGTSTWSRCPRPSPPLPGTTSGGAGSSAEPSSPLVTGGVLSFRHDPRTFRGRSGPGI